MVAISTGSVAIFAELALHDPTIITKTYGILGNCPTSELKLSNRAPFLAYPLEHGPGTWSCPLSRTAGTRDLESMKLLLDHGLDANDRVSRCLEIDPAIYIAIKQGHLAIADLTRLSKTIVALLLSQLLKTRLLLPIWLICSGLGR